jgi:hypothetical protein
VLAVGAILAVVALAACSGDDSPTTAAPGAPSVTLPDDLAPASTTSAPTTSTTTTASPQGCGLCLTVEAPLRCDGSSFVATVQWEDLGANAAGLLVDGVQVDDDVAPAGPHDLTVACDGRAHTVILVVTIPGADPVQASVAVRSSPAA